MARSSYVYVIIWSGVPFGTFTVRHELRAWLKQQRSLDGYVLYRLRDGDPGRSSAAELSIHDVLAEL